jgi:hypothetical protein
MARLKESTLLLPNGKTKRIYPQPEESLKRRTGFLGMDLGNRRIGI